jgi:hypothetical protein
MTRDELIDAIIAEMERVWGAEGLNGDMDEYAWLATHYNITEEEDVKWQFVREQDLPEEDREDLDPDDPDDARFIAFLNDPGAVVAFLETLLQKYRSNIVSYPR